MGSILTCTRVPVLHPLFCQRLGGQSQLPRLIPAPHIEVSGLCGTGSIGGGPRSRAQPCTVPWRRLRAPGAPALTVCGTAPGPGLPRHQGHGTAPARGRVLPPAAPTTRTQHGPSPLTLAECHPPAATACIGTPANASTSRGCSSDSSVPWPSCPCLWGDTRTDIHPSIISRTPLPSSPRPSPSCPSRCRVPKAGGAAGGGPSLKVKPGDPTGGKLGLCVGWWHQPTQGAFHAAGTQGR